MARRLEFWYSNGLQRELRKGTNKGSFEYDGMTFYAIQIKKEIYIVYNGYYMFKRPSDYSVEAVIDLFKTFYEDTQCNKDKVEDFANKIELLDVAEWE